MTNKSWPCRISVLHVIANASAISLGKRTPIFCKRLKFTDTVRRKAFTIVLMGKISYIIIAIKLIQLATF